MCLVYFDDITHLAEQGVAKRILIKCPATRVDHERDQEKIDGLENKFLFHFFDAKLFFV